MKKLILGGIGLALAIGMVCVVLIPSWRQTLLPFLATQESYKDKPSSYWASALKGQNADFKAWQAAAQDLETGGAQAVPVLKQTLQDADAQVRWRTIRVLSKIQNKDVVPDLVKLQKDKEKLVRQWAAYAVLVIAPDDAAISVPDLLEAMIDSDKVRGGELGPAIDTALEKMPAKSKLPSLMEALKNNNPDYRARAAIVLGHMGEDAKEAIPLLINLLRDRNVDSNKRALYTTASEALGKIDPDARERAVKDLIVILQNPTSKERYGAVYALGKLGPVAKPSVPELVKVIKEKDKDAKLAKDALEALRHIDQDAAAEFLIGD